MTIVSGGKLASPERIDSNADLDSIGVEESGRARWLPAVNRQVSQGHAEAQGIEMELLQLGRVIRGPLDAGHDDAAKIVDRRAHV